VSEPISFEHEIKPLFRPRDHGAMRSSFDLWSYDDVSANADAIYQAVEEGSMPCDGAWPAESVELLKRWIDAGKPA
jgi:hypothetical protein